MPEKPGAGAPGGSEEMARLQPAFLIEHANHGAHAVIRCDDLLENPAFAGHFIDFVFRFLNVLFPGRGEPLVQINQFVVTHS